MRVNELPTDDQTGQKTDDQQKKKSNTAVMAVRKTHGELDRKRREWLACVSSSKQNEDTAGSSFERKLGEKLVQAEGMDKKLLEYDIAYSRDNILTDEQIIEAGSTCTELVKAMKEAQRYATTIRSMLKGSKED